MTETIDSTKAAATTLFLGHNGEWWDFSLIVAGILVSLAAVAAVVATAGSIVAHKREAATSEEALARYKLDTAKDIADANARAAEANARAEEAKVEFQKFKAPRVLTSEQRAAIVEELKGKVSEINIVTQVDAEARQYGLQFRTLLSNAGIKVRNGSFSAMATLILGPPNSVSIWSPNWLLNGYPNPDDPLYKAVSRAGIWGGGGAAMFIPDTGSELVAPEVPTIYIGQKAPW
jgi:hypothetical protein